MPVGKAHQRAGITAPEPARPQTKQKRPAEAGRFELNYAAKPLKDQRVWSLSSALQVASVSPVSAPTPALNLGQSPQ